MSALNAGVQAPEFTLQGTDGKRWSLAEARQRGPVVLAFFKISCPVCQYAMPYLQRLHEAYAGQRVSVVGVSQNALRETLAFMKEYGVTFPVVLDDARTYPVSNAYGLTNVPTVFLVGTEGTIKVSSVGWSRHDIEDINVDLARTVAIARSKVFHPGEDVAEFKPG
jgi:peroxiredoxin